MQPNGLQHEIGKRHPFGSLEQEAFLNLVRTHSVFAAEFGQLFRRYDLSEATYNTLRILRGAGREGRTCGEIGSMLVARVPDVTRLVDRLVESGLVSRLRAQEDRRVVKVMISSLGLERLAALDEPVIKLHREQLGHMTDEQLRQLSDLLELARQRPGACGGSPTCDGGDSAMGSCDGR